MVEPERIRDPELLRAYDALCDNGLEELPETVSLNAAIDAASPPE